jgi:HptB-dependent secretion and biofilm anti anti-sigma factor
MTTTAHLVNNKAIVSVKGRFDFSASREFQRTCTNALATLAVKEVEIDLGEVQFIDSSALGLLLMLREQGDNTHKAISLSNCHGAVKQVLDIANFSKLFHIK